MGVKPGSGETSEETDDPSPDEERVRHVSLAPAKCLHVASHLILTAALCAANPCTHFTDVKTEALEMLSSSPKIIALSLSPNPSW